MDPVRTTKRVVGVRGQICPYPDVNTMTTLKQMNKGEILEVLADYPLSVERIPRSAKKWGHKTLAVEKLDGPNRRLLIEAYGFK